MGPACIEATMTLQIISNWQAENGPCLYRGDNPSTEQRGPRDNWSTLWHARENAYFRMRNNKEGAEQ